MLQTLCQRSIVVLRPVLRSPFGKSLSIDTAKLCLIRCLVTAPDRTLSFTASKRLHRFRLSRELVCAATDRNRLVFLGTPEVAATSLTQLLHAAAEPDSRFEIAGVVTQPGRAKGRGRKAQPSPVETAAREGGVEAQHIYCPEKARDADFLEALRELQPDLCVTAAYGNILPQSFLDIPKFGTLNIHPSLLPAYRGAAPVQHALLDGVATTGVSVAFTVRAMDAGPVLAQEEWQVDDRIQGPQLLQALFKQGTELLLEQLPLVWDGSAASLARAQDEASSTHAAKLTKADSWLDFNKPAKTLHNQVRALAGWPGTTHDFVLRKQDGSESSVTLKVLETKVADQRQQVSPDVPEFEVEISAKCMFVRCGDGNALELLQVQPAGKKPMESQAFVNGLAGCTLSWHHKLQ